MSYILKSASFFIQINASLFVYFSKIYSAIFRMPADTYSGNKSASLLSLKISALARQRRKVESATI